MSRTVPESKLFLFAISNFVLLGITSKVSLFGIKGKFLSQSMPHGALRTSNHYKFQQAEGQRAPCYSRTRLKTNNRRHFDTKHNNTAIKPTLPAGSYAELRGRPPHRRSALRTARSSALPRGAERSSAAGTAAEERPARRCARGSRRVPAQRKMAAGPRRRRAARRSAARLGASGRPTGCCRQLPRGAAGKALFFKLVQRGLRVYRAELTKGTRYRAPASP